MQHVQRPREYWHLWPQQRYHPLSNWASPKVVRVVGGHCPTCTTATHSMHACSGGLTIHCQAPQRFLFFWLSQGSFHSFASNLVSSTASAAGGNRVATAVVTLC
jgi:hypothetical protein